jgi:hypothetical protein
MEQLTTQKKLVNITTSNKISNLSKELYHINYLINYPLSDNMIEGWERTLNELEPEITAEVIKWIVDNSKLGFFEWDNKKGIQNIFEGFRKYINYKIALDAKESNDGYFPQKPINNKWNFLYVKYKKNKYDNQMVY